MRITLLTLSLIICVTAFVSGAGTTAPSAAETATTFLKTLEKGELDEAMKLWDTKAVNERMKERMKKMSSKIIKSGGIKTLETPPVEPRPRNLAAHEVVVVVVYGNGDLAFGSVSFVEQNGEFRISNLRSEKGWGGTTSLFDDAQTESNDANE